MTSVTITIEDMVQRGVHLGHQACRWNPKMAPYIYRKQNGVHIIDLVQSFAQLKQVSHKLTEWSLQGKSFLFVGTKRSASDIVERVAMGCGCFYVSQRWLGGILTNWKSIQRSLQTLEELESRESSDHWQRLPKKEATALRKRRERLQRYLGGLKGMVSLPDVVIVVGQVEERNAVLECKRLGIPTVSVLDTDCDPTLTDLFVVANDDSIKSLDLLCNVFLNSILAGKESRKMASKQAISKL